MENKFGASFTVETLKIHFISIFYILYLANEEGIKYHPNSCQLEHGTNIFVLVLITQKTQKNYHELSKSIGLKNHL
jgi:hypothetical protein